MGLFSKKPKVQPPYDSLTVEQQRALYFLLEYFAKYATGRFGSIKQDAISYLEKALWYFGISKKDVELLRPYHRELSNLESIIFSIKDYQVYDYMVNNCYNLVILAEGDNYEPAHTLFYEFWNKFGYTPLAIRGITQQYMYRTDI